MLDDQRGDRATEQIFNMVQRIAVIG